MKLLHFLANNQPELALLYKGNVLPVRAAAEAAKLPPLPATLDAVLEDLEVHEPTLRIVDSKFRSGDFEELALEYHAVKLQAPVLKPNSCRDAYAFRQHVATSRANRGKEMIPEFDHFPVFYFTNHRSIFGPGEVPLMVDHFQKLDYELEAAIVIGKRGRNIACSKAEDYIFGLTLLNDLSSRRLQMEEMKLNLGPAKGKDFANVLGPVLVTLDELEEYRTEPKEGHTGRGFNLAMKASINGKLYSEGNLASMDWSFEEIIERVSYGVDIFPTDVIGSGTVGTGCLLELNGTRSREEEDYDPVWLQPNDMVTLEMDAVGKLESKLIKASDYSLLELKHI